MHRQQTRCAIRDQSFQAHWGTRQEPEKSACATTAHSGRTCLLQKSLGWYHKILSHVTETVQIENQAQWTWPDSACILPKSQHIRGRWPIPLFLCSPANLPLRSLERKCLLLTVGLSITAVLGSSLTWVPVTFSNKFELLKTDLHNNRSHGQVKCYIKLNETGYKQQHPQQSVHGWTALDIPLWPLYVTLTDWIHFTYTSAQVLFS